MIRRLKMLKTSIFSRLISRLDATPIKFPEGFFVDIDKPIQCEETKKSKTTKKKREKIGGLNTTQFQDIIKLQ